MHNCAIDYYPTTFSADGPLVMGVNAANEGLINGLIRHATVDALVCHVRNEGEAKDFQARVERLGQGHRPHTMVRNGDTVALGRVGALFHPAPGFGPLAWVRRFGPQHAYSLCGISHTTATERVLDSIGNLMVAPVQPWDAVICTSTVVRRTYDRVLADWRDYLADRVGGRPFCPVQLPIIPLGVDVAAFAADATRDAAGQALRRQFGMGVDDIIILWVGRFNHRGKAHPIPAYLAVERMATQLKAPPAGGGAGRRVLFLQCGWFHDGDTRDAFIQAALDHAPTALHAFIDGRDPVARRGAWSAADIFLSLPDNIQETFGLTPIEAMAAGLPVVVSDWNGYRDTVRHGVDGFRIPTWMPPEGDGGDLAKAFTTGALSGDAYTGAACQAIGVDVGACANALLRLAEDPALRRRMGAAGQRRAADVYDWRHIIAAYQDLWAELARIRASAAAVAPRADGAPAHPLRADPFGSFASYATLALDDDTALRLGGVVSADRLTALRQSPLNQSAFPPLGDEMLCRAVLDRLARGSVRLGDLMGAYQGSDATLLRRTVSWLAKMGLVDLARG
ncbi:glycosyltransferase family 4 protein [Nitrospirillum iridis]|uniref:Glycosyltransferase involved in cell wall biosynthesis n=1 Tax=Nitrospirillum iridis TaxID=765888 RepID=A0A7X0B210_9PROT|nr:glycosyltransferase family 4 protein [Nitrospirillum iridis]MBB6252936.1 glycosyltransferase involved in cell wall biosynthesis [Nitrospirillum iridis]